MKKTSKKLLLSSLALIITLALTATSTYAWFNMNTSVETSFDVTISGDTGIQMAVVPYSYTYGTATVEFPSSTDEKTITYKNTLTESDFGTLFTANALKPATLARDGETTTPVYPLAFQDVGGTPITAFSQSTVDSEVYNVSHLKFRIYIRSTSTKNIYLSDTSLAIVPKVGGEEKAKSIPVSDIDLAEEIITALDTTGAGSYADWKAGTKATPFSLTDHTQIGKYLEGTISCTDDVCSISGGLLHAKDYTKAYRVAFEGDTDNAGTKIIADTDSVNTADAVATTNIAWIYYNFGTAKAFKAPITAIGSSSTPLTVLPVAVGGDGYTYSYVDVTVWLEGFDGECFDSILGVTGSLKFKLSSSQG